VQFPLARAYTQVLAADMMRNRAAALFDAGEKCGAEANAAKFVASEASWQAANVCRDTHGGDGFVDKYNVERKFRETRVYQVAPVNNNMILAFLGQHVPGPGCYPGSIGVRQRDSWFVMCAAELVWPTRS
jgi:acyl-CoA dehydrogenase